MSSKRPHNEILLPNELDDSSGRLVPLTKSDVPAYLHRSEFYLSLAEDDDQQILVPRECLKSDDTVSTTEDLRLLLLTLRFWVADKIAESILDFVFSHPFEKYEEVIAEFYDEMPDLKHIKTIITAKKPFRRAISRNVLQFVQYMHNSGKHEWPEGVCAHLAEKGQLEMLEYAIESGCILSASAPAAAAMYGRLDCLKLLHEHNCPWDERTTDAAVKYNRLEFLRYAHENGCPWRDATERVDGNTGANNICTLAAARGQLECLRYAYNQGVILQTGIIVTARGSLECVKFLHEQGISLDNALLCRAAVRTNNLKLLTYLHENGCSLRGELYLHALGNCDEDIFDYLHNNGCPWDASVCEYAAKEGYPGAVLYLLRHGCPPSNNIWSFKNDLFQPILQAFEGAGHAPQRLLLCPTS